jgi:hypothetical protein
LFHWILFERKNNLSSSVSGGLFETKGTIEVRALSMKYEPYDALYWFTQLGAERGAMPWHRASLATTLMGQYRAPVFQHKSLKQFYS